MSSRPSTAVRLLLATILFLVSFTVFADAPGARTQARVVYDSNTGKILLFGGATAFDAATRKVFDLNETWEWTGNQWIQKFPATVPPARSAHVMVFDTNHSQVVVFGGRTDTNVESNDTWVYTKDDWHKVDTPSTPPARLLAGGAFDPLRDRVVMFGGRHTVTSGPSGRTITQEPYFDTWEFDGTTWTQVNQNGPHVDKPLLAYDKARSQMVMLGLDNDSTSSATVMYGYNPSTRAWDPIRPTLLPPCVNESGLTYQTHNDTLFLNGGTCITSSVSDEAYTWDGTNWTKVDLLGAGDRAFGLAITYDEARAGVFQYGGTQSVPVSFTYFIRDGIVFGLGDFFTPTPRSLFAFERDPVNNIIYLYGGVDENGFLSDFWKFQFGRWERIPAQEKSPGECAASSTFDTDRNKLILFCGVNIFEWDGTAFTNFTGLQKQPPFREFAKIVYDKTLKKTVLFGGLDPTGTSGIYLNDTWTWNGTTWTEEKPRKRPPARDLTTMWFDPTLNKTVIYGGLGRPTPSDRVERYDDMWTYDGSTWTELEISTTPGQRFGALFTVDPRSNKLVLFGGMRIDTDSAGVMSQVYANDMWEWDGATWRQLQTNGVPPGRENGGLQFDATTNSIVLFGGWSAVFRSDRWQLDGASNWQVKQDVGVPQRRRAAGH